MKLELKHLAPYLPYGLKVFRDTGETSEILELSSGKIMLWQDGYYESFKPILRPLSDLTKEIKYGLSTYAFTDLFEIGDFDGCIFEFEHGNIKTIALIESIANNTAYNDINYLPHAVVIMMLEHHFDVFGLIEQGLAIDINALNDNYAKL